MTTRVIAIAALALWVVTIAAGAWLFFRGYTRPAEDGRTAVVLAPAERELVLAEMRAMLGTVHGVVTALANEDRAALAEAARAGGTQAAPASPALMAKIPQPFMEMGMGVHQGFDAMAAAADEGAPFDALQQRLAAQLGTCVACHAAWRIETP